MEIKKTMKTVPHEPTKAGIRSTNFIWYRTTTQIMWMTRTVARPTKMAHNLYVYRVKGDTSFTHSRFRNSMSKINNCMTL